jgi:hypothetical protein
MDESFRDVLAPGADGRAANTTGRASARMTERVI